MDKIIEYFHKFALLPAVAGASLACIFAGAVPAASAFDHRRPLDIHRQHDRRERTPRARAAIVGGSQIEILRAPWQAEIFAEIEGGTILCGGSIIDLTHILTAGHCVFNPETGQPLPPKAFVIVAGTSSITAEAIKTDATVQARFVQGVRPHPYFHYAEGPGAADDVAVLELAAALKATPAVQPIGLAPTSSTPAEGTPVNLTGFGQQNPESKPDEQLYSLGMTLGFSRQCGGEADALFVCASAPLGSACRGDSGSGLTTGLPATLLGVMSIIEVVSKKECQDGAVNGFTNLAAPEIQDFIAGSETPPQAPRGGGVVVRAKPEVGYTVTCEPGVWSNGPTFSYAFIDSTSGHTLQTGPSTTYQLTSADVGRTIFCQVQVSNAGGTGVERTTALQPVKAAPSGQTPQPEGQTPQAPAPKSANPPVEVREAAGVSLAGTVLAVQGDVASVKLDCKPGASCSGKLTLAAESTSKKKSRRKSSGATTIIGTARFSIPAGRNTTVKIVLDATGRALIGAGHGRLLARLTILQLKPEPAQPRTETVRLTPERKTHKSKR